MDMIHMEGPDFDGVDNEFVKYDISKRKYDRCCNIWSRW